VRLMEIIQSALPLNDRARNEILFRGDLIVFTQIPALLELQGLLDQLIQQTLGDRFEAIDVHSKDFSALMTELQRRFNVMPQARDLFAQALEQSGMDVTCNFADKLFLRCVPPTEKSKAQYRGSIGYHRDTWGSNIQHQINWWTPLYPITEENTLVFYPDYWDVPVANTTAEWSFEAFREARLLATSQSADAQINYPYAPEATEVINTINGVPILIKPGDLLCFPVPTFMAAALNLARATVLTWKCVLMARRVKPLHRLKTSITPSLSRTIIGLSHSSKTLLHVARSDLKHSIINEILKLTLAVA